MESFRYNLVFDTSLNSAGADAAANAIRRVDDAAARATRSSGSNGSMMSQALQDNAAKARVSEFAYYDLDAAIKKTNSSGQNFVSGTGQISRGSRDASRSLLMFSQGFEDAQYGIRGVLNNIPGLIMALGGTAGLAGAISIAAVAGSVLFEWLGKTEVKASDTAEKLKEIGEKAGEIKSDKIAQMTQGLWDAWDAADATRQNFEETKKAADSFATSALSDAEKMRTAQQLIAEVLGEQVNYYNTLAQQSEQASQKRELAAQQEIRKQQEVIQSAGDELLIAQEKLQTARSDQAINSQNLIEEKAKLKILEDQHMILTKQSKEKMGWAEALATESSLPYITPSEKSWKAKDQMDAPGYAFDLESTRARVKALEEAVGKPSAELNRKVVSMENQVSAADTAAQDKISAATVKIQELQATLEADTTVADAQLAVDQSKALADGLKETMTKINAGTDQQKEAKAYIEKAAADGKITANELVDVSRNLTALVGGLQAGLSTSTENVAQLINQMRSYQSDQAILASELKTLKSNYETLKRRP